MLLIADKSGIEQGDFEPMLSVHNVLGHFHELLRLEALVSIIRPGIQVRVGVGVLKARHL
jgi:hypothetical protein